MRSLLSSCLPCPSFMLVLLVANAGWASEPPVATKPPAASPSPTPAQTKLNAPSPQFNGRDLAGWKIPKEHFFKNAGRVFWKEDQVILEAGDPGTAIAWNGEVPRQNYEVSFEARRLKGDDFFCGLTFPIDQSYCTLILGGWGGSTTGLSNIDGFAAVENETTGYVEFQQERWYRVRLRVTKQQIRAWVDNQQIVDLDPQGKRFEIWWEQEPVRPLGVASWNTQAALRKFRVVSLP